MATELLSVVNLHTSFFTPEGEVKAVRGVSFDVGPGEVVALVGESGCGKSVTALSIMQLVPSPPGCIKAGQILWDGRDMRELSEAQMQRIRGNEIAMIFQDPMTSLNPVLTIGTQMLESVRRHQRLDYGRSRRRALEILEMVGIPSPEGRLAHYPHQLSGGMRQRVMIAMALSCRPRLLIADEPTTALDVTIQAQILEILKDLKLRLEAAIILITHDLGVVAGLADRVLVMYAGEVVEQGTVHEIFARPRHPYTWGLLRSLPRLDDLSKRRLVPIRGQPPDLLDPPGGCAFHPRCPHAMQVCGESTPGLFGCRGIPGGPVEAVPPNLTREHWCACWLLHPKAPKPVQEVHGEVAAP